MSGIHKLTISLQLISLLSVYNNAMRTTKIIWVTVVAAALLIGFTADQLQKWVLLEANDAEQECKVFRC